MKLLLTILSFFILISAFTQEIPEIVFNELNSDNPGGPDNSEFIELFGTQNASLDSLVLVLFEGSTDLSYASYDLDGYNLDENGFFVIGSATVVNVDLIIPNATLSNGQDAVALYRADAADYPANTSPSPQDLIDAAVYGTSDPTDMGLIASLGLDLLTTGYTQLDETTQQSGTDLSLSRFPDGGVAFENNTFILQEITPGTWNEPQCLAGTIANNNGENQLTYCDNLFATVIHYSNDPEAIGDTAFYVLTTESLNIVQVTGADSMDISGYISGNYRLYSVAASGLVDEQTTVPGLLLTDISASSCTSVSANYIEISIISCSGCFAGEIQNESGNATAYCAGSSEHLVLTNTSTSDEDNYLYILIDNADVIIDTFSYTYNLAELIDGSYRLYGMSYLGELDVSSVSSGSHINGLNASICYELTSAPITFEIFACPEFNPCEYVFISEYLEGNNGTKALELFNPSLTTIDLQGYAILSYSNGSSVATDQLQLEGSLGPLSTYVIANPGTPLGNGQADPTLLALADVLDAVSNFSGNDAIELRFNDTIIDVIGVVGEDPGAQSGWMVGDASTRDVDLVRRWNIQSPMPVWDISNTQWDTYVNTNYTNVGNHLFDPCVDDLFGGFLSSEITIDENVGTIEITLQCLNAQNEVTLDLQISGGSANSLDYNTNFANSFVFDGSTSILTLTIDIIDDVTPEMNESIHLSLSSQENVYWLNQFMTITILQNDVNCDGGFIETSIGNQTIEQCSDSPNAPIEISASTEFPSAQYSYVLTNLNDSILEVFDASPVSLDSYASGTYRIFGLSYTGTLDETTINAQEPISGIVADSCVSISINSIIINRTPCVITGCDGGSVTTLDGAIFQTVCAGDESNIIIPQNTGQSTDDSYTYFLTNASDIIVEELSGSWEANSAVTGNYRIWGVSYSGDFVPSSIMPGQPVSSISSEGCVGISLNFIEVMTANCTGSSACTELFFSEMLEDSQSDKAIELYNPSPFPVDLSDFVVNIYQDGSLSPTGTLQCAGILAPYDVYVIVSNGNGQNPTNQLILDQADTLHQVAAFSGNDALELIHNSETIDIIGVIGENPGLFGWTFGNSSTANHDLVRRPEVTSPNEAWGIVSGQWISYDQLVYTNLGFHNGFDCGASNLPQVSFVLSSQTIAENSATIIVEVQTSNVLESFELTITASGSATSGLDFGDIFPQVLWVPSGNNTISININIFEDDISDGNETIELQMSTSETVLFGNASTVITIEDHLGLKEDFQHLTLAPNPCNHQLFINSTEPMQTIKLFDMQGRLVSTHNSNASLNFVYDTSRIESGPFILVVETSGTVLREQVIISR